MLKIANDSNENENNENENEEKQPEVDIDSDTQAKTPPVGVYIFNIDIFVVVCFYLFTHSFLNIFAMLNISLSTKQSAMNFQVEKIISMFKC